MRLETALMYLGESLHIEKDSYDYIRAHAKECTHKEYKENEYEIVGLYDSTNRE